MPSLSCVIVNWNRESDLVSLLEDLCAQTSPADAIVVVDNGSSDGTAERLESDFPHVRLVRLHRNMGLSFGRNVGLVSCKSDCVAIMDNDLRIPDPHFLKKVRSSLDAHPDCGVISFHCIEGLWNRNASGLQGRLFSIAQLAEMARLDQAPIEGRSFYDWFFWGGACVIRREVFERIGAFDDVFDYGGEEWDFSYRCHEAGIRLLRDQNLWVVHARSPRMRSAELPFLILKNMIVAQSRYMPFRDLLLFLTMQLSKSFADAVRGGKLGGFLSVGLELLLTWRKQVLKRRKPVSRKTMRRFYYLRIHEAGCFSEAEGAETGGLDFYLHQARKRKSSPKADHVYAAMYEDSSAGCSQA